MIYTVTLNPTIDRTMVFPRLDVGELNRATQSRTDLSGKGVNVSVALRQLGLESTMIGIAAGVYGRLLLNGLRDMGYDCDFIEVAGETRSNVTVIDEARNETTKLNEPGPTVSAADLAALAERLAARIAPGDLCVFSGSLPPGAPADIYARLVAIVQGAGGRAVLDTSGPALKAGCPARPDLLKPNEVEAVELVAHSLEGDAALLAALREIAAMGPPRVLMSLGPRGAAYLDAAGAWLATPPPIVEVNAVGAGDALTAAGLWAWQRTVPPDEMVRWAVAGGTAAASQEGTTAPSLERVAQVYEQVQVRPLG
jgi:1-phosphofructokinase family hexose kinase